MAETIGPFKLGLSVNFSPPLGVALDALRISIDLLRKQMNTTRLGLIIGAWAGVGPVLEPGRQIGRSTEPDHSQGAGAQRLALAPVNDQLGRLHQNLTRLNQVISGLAVVNQQTSSAAANDSSRSQQRSAAPTEEAPDKSKLTWYAAVATLFAGSGYVASRRAPAHRRREGRQAGKEVASEDWLDVVLDVGKALATGEDGKEQAEGAGTAAGGFFGKVIGTASGIFFSDNKRVQKRSAAIGTALGEVIGHRVGGEVFDASQGQPKPAAAKASAVAPAGQANDADTGQQEQQPQVEEATQNATAPMTKFAAVVGVYSRVATTAIDAVTGKDWLAIPPALSDKQSAEASVSSAAPDLLQLIFAKVGASSAFSQPGRGLKRLPGLVLADTTLQLASAYSSDATPAQKGEVFGSALGGLSGGLAGVAAGAALGSFVPVIGTAVGGLVGGVLGSLGGEQIGGWLARLVTAEAPSAEQPKPDRESGPVAPVPTINQQVTFTANMPVTFNNSLDDPATLLQLQAIARSQLEELMRQARAVQMFEIPHVG
ncbi:hypothetical protein [Pseudomonas shirazensis]|uniref:hypothetical protein n=1 Tax=Pseudomonas shirazensis TaxID=2745494 RepID=UPI003D26B016